MDLNVRNRVLVADDDPGIRLLLMTSLRLHGFQTIGATSGRETLAEMRAGSADLVIMDLMMPEGTGWDVLRARASEPALQRIPVIVITANNSREVRADILGRRVCALISKPFDLDVLLKSVAAGLSHPEACAAATDGTRPVNQRLEVPPIEPPLVAPVVPGVVRHEKHRATLALWP